MKMNKVSVWETTFAEFFLEDDDIYNNLVKRMQSPGELNERPYKNHILAGETEFSSWVLQCAKQYTKMYDQPEWGETFHSHNIERAWVNCQYYGQSLEIHSHAPAVIASAFYVESNPDVHPCIEFVDPRPPHFFNNVYRKNYDGDIHGSFRSVKFNPEKRKLLLFPGYLIHHVPVNMSQDVRVVIGMNINCKR